MPCRRPCGLGSPVASCSVVLSARMKPLARVSLLFAALAMAACEETPAIKVAASRDASADGGSGDSATDGTTTAPDGSGTALPDSGSPAATLTIAPVTIDFGDVVFDSEARRQFTVTNTGTGPSAVPVVSATDPF